MFKKVVLVFITVCTLTSYKTDNTDNFVKPLYTDLPLGSIRPTSWLRDQLEIMRDGTTGHLDEVYAKIKNDNGQSADCGFPGGKISTKFNSAFSHS